MIISKYIDNIVNETFNFPTQFINEVHLVSNLSQLKNQLDAINPYILVHYSIDVKINIVYNLIHYMKESKARIITSKLPTFVLKRITNDVTRLNVSYDIEMLLALYNTKRNKRKEREEDNKGSNLALFLMRCYESIE